VNLAFCLDPEYLISGYHGLHFNKTLKPSIMIAAFMPGAVIGDRVFILLNLLRIYVRL